MAKRKRQQRQSNVHDSARRTRVERNQLTDLVVNEKLVTTHTKAKELQKKMDRLITIGKKDTVHARREVAKILRNVKLADDKTTAVQKLFNEIVPRYKNRNGGYTKVLKFGERKGDAAPVSIIMFV